MADVEIRGLDGVLHMLSTLPAEVVSKRGGPVKASLRKGANVIAKAERRALRATLRTEPDDETTGLLGKSIIVSRGKKPTSGQGERYLVRIKRKTYTDRTGKPTTTLKTAQLKEYGSSQQDAEPFIRPAFLQNAERAIRTVEEDLPKQIEKIAAGLTQKGR